ncbi:MAG: tetratricopeptide (TPR) repeat protein [Bradymonadia bacterium]|jgi:tetratricopeptide (TPR) repeat protein
MSHSLSKCLASCALTALVSGACTGDPETLVSGPEFEQTQARIRVLTPAPIRVLASLPYERALTRPDVAEQNLNGQVRVAEQLPAARSRLLDLYGLRIGMFGQFSDLALGMEFAESQTLTAPMNSEMWVQRASAEASVHRFSDALVSLDRAEALGADTSDPKDMLSLALRPATAELATRLCRAAEARPTYQTHTACASAQASMGRYALADDHYGFALDGYADVSPFPVAWVQFQRGVMWGEMADNQEVARRLYEDAVRILPGYVVANVHLAELEFEAGEFDLASARLERVAEREDPEPLSRLAQFLAEQPAPDMVRSAEAQAEALSRWNAVLDGERAAYLDHGAEFFMAAGDDAERGLSLALENLENRQTERALLLALDAALHAGSQTLACELLRSVPGEPKRVALAELVGALTPQCG